MGTRDLEEPLCQSLSYDYLDWPGNEIRMGAAAAYGAMHQAKDNACRALGKALQLATEGTRRIDNPTGYRFILDLYFEELVAAVVEERSVFIQKDRLDAVFNALRDNQIASGVNL